MDKVIFSGTLSEVKVLIKKEQAQPNQQYLEKFQRDFLDEMGVSQDYFTKMKINNRLKTCCGKFKRVNGESIIEISGYRFALAMISEDVRGLVSTIKHETIHAVLFKQKKDYHDGDKAFEDMLVKYNVSSSGKTNKNKAGNTHRVDYYVINNYKTPNGHIYRIYNQMNIVKYVNAQYVEGLIVVEES